MGVEDGPVSMRTTGGDRVLCETVGQGPALSGTRQTETGIRLATMVGSGNALTDCQLLWLVVEVVRSSCTAGTLVSGYHGTNLMAEVHGAEHTVARP